MIAVRMFGWRPVWRCTADQHRSALDGEGRLPDTPRALRAEACMSTEETGTGAEQYQRQSVPALDILPCTVSIESYVWWDMARLPW